MAEEDRAIYYVKKGDETSFYRDKTVTGTLSHIEAFVREIEKGGVAFALLNVRNGIVLRRGNIAKYYGYMSAFLSEYSLEKVYTPHVQEFFSVCVGQMGLTASDFTAEPFRPITNGEKKAWVVFNEIVEEISRVVKSREFKRKVYARAEVLKKGFNGTKMYVDALFEKYAKLLVIRVDFSFQFDENGEAISLKKAQEEFAKFLTNKRSKALYKNCVGYIWRLEFGEKKGYHYHLFFFFDGSKSQQHVFLAWEIGKDWITITEGKGMYFNCNAKAERKEYLHVGIGKVSHDDACKREVLLKVLSYLYKTDQLIKEKLSEKTKTWGKGGMPSAISGLGRPRRVSSS
nr:inovirus-type Gp2 protein [uncultured Duganella sp.]